MAKAPAPSPRGCGFESGWGCTFFFFFKLKIRSIQVVLCAFLMHSCCQTRRNKSLYVALPSVFLLYINWASCCTFCCTFRCTFCCSFSCPICYTFCCSYCCTNGFCRRSAPFSLTGPFDVRLVPLLNTKLNSELIGKKYTTTGPSLYILLACRTSG